MKTYIDVRWRIRRGTNLGRQIGLSMLFNWKIFLIKVHISVEVDSTGINIKTLIPCMTILKANANLGLEFKLKRGVRAKERESFASKHTEYSVIGNLIDNFS